MVPFETPWLDLLARDDRLMVDSASECWPWRGTIQSKGYGTVNGQLVHRVVYELARGPIPAGLQIDHLCRNRRCANPAHLEVVTPKENFRRGEGHKALALSWKRRKGKARA